MTRSVVYSRAFASLLATSLMSAAPLAQAQTTTTTETAAPAAAPALPAWLNHVTISGDLRLRIEHSRDYSSTPTVEQTRPRVRPRFGVTGKVADNLSASLRLRTGGTGAGTAGSSNQTLGDFGGAKTFGVDLVFLDYRPITGLTVQVGKTKNPFWSAMSNEMVWNGSYNPEGLSAKFQADINSIKPYIAASYQHLYDRKSGPMESASIGPDVTMMGAQLGVSFKPNPILAALAVGFYSFNNIQGFPSVTGTAPDTTRVISGEGNSIDESNLFAHGYKLLNVGAELGYVIADLPIVAFGEWVRNLDPDNDNQALLGGLKVGTLKEPGTWALKAAYRDVASDAVFSPVAESTFLLGGTGVYGMEYVAYYQLSQGISVSLTGENGMKSGSRRQSYRLDVMAAF